MTPSPCINVCRMDAATGWCEGCQRTLQEIGTWSGLSDADKRAVWQALPARRETWLRLHPQLRAAPAPAVARGPLKGDPA
jgi:predicted Fe-S protein YdhL (DUF1289 family)